MAKILIPAQAVEDWKRFLAEPEKQWRDGYSAKGLAECWQAVSGFPSEVEKVLKTMPSFGAIEMRFSMPEIQTPLPGGARPSQTDLWVLAWTADGLVSIAVEGEVSEPFGDLVADWPREPTPGKQKRLGYLCDLLEMNERDTMALRYQLLHSTASAVLEARRVFAPYAVMLVHSFSARREWYKDFDAFVRAIEERRDPVRWLGSARETVLTCAWDG